jgi:excisionase family DNA binding protein
MGKCNLATIMASNAEITAPESPWHTAGEAASYLKIERKTLLLWVRQGKLKGYPLSGTERVTWRFLRDDLDAMLLSPSVASANRRKM